MRKRQSLPVSEDDAGSQPFAPDDMRMFELALLSASNSFNRWVVSCGGATGELGLGSTDFTILRMGSREARPKRASEIAFALNIEDVHVVTYSIKKLIRAGFVETQKNGKESLFQASLAGQDLLTRYDAIRTKCLINTLKVFNEGDLDVSLLARRLRAISGIYEQAARAATAL